jgi:hypothetical protein
LGGGYSDILAPALGKPHIVIQELLNCLLDGFLEVYFFLRELSTCYLCDFLEAD